MKTETLKKLNYSWDFIWTKTFKKGYADYPYKNVFEKILSDIKRNPYSGANIKKLQGEWNGFHRYRKGDFRIIYQIKEAEKQIILVALASRGSIY